MLQGLKNSVIAQVLKWHVEPQFKKANKEIEQLKAKNPELLKEIIDNFDDQIPVLLDAKIALTKAAIAKLEADESKENVAKAQKKLNTAKQEMTDAIQGLIDAFGEEGFQEVLKMLPMGLAKSSDPKVLVADQITTVNKASAEMKERMVAGYKGVKPLLPKYKILFERVYGDLPIINISKEILDNTTKMLLSTLGASLLPELKKLMALDKENGAKAGKPITHARDAKAPSANRKRPAAVSESESEEDEEEKDNETKVDIGDSWGDLGKAKPKARKKR